MLRFSHGSIPRLSDAPSTQDRMQRSVDILDRHLQNGWYIYGVNTGFGGSADSRTKEVVALQSSLMQLTQAGILTLVDLQTPSKRPCNATHAMPAAWVRATMAAVARLLEARLTPVTPLRGTVSASGDLMPLAYIAGAIEGSPDIFVEVSDSADGKIMPARDALQLKGLSPVTLRPKEGLGLVNGTASSAALGALLTYTVQQQAVLVQALTAMAVEALRGSAESFHPFIAAVRPHPGQVEVASNISAFLSGSHLARGIQEPRYRRQEDLIQDRYSLRSAPQWIGPQLEDLMLAYQQVNIELNSSCDNPLIDTGSGHEDGANSILYGCNFQAAAITSAVEKIRLALQMFGRLLFSQLTEMVDPTYSGLPANLAADDPSISFTFKGVDISMAAYMAELSYLANPMSSHVQAAEMHNQSVNSMAFASARLSMQASDILNLMCSNHLYACCQAVDLQILHQLFLVRAQQVLKELAAVHFNGLDKVQQDRLCALIDTLVPSSWKTSTKADLKDRCSKLAASLLPAIIIELAESASSENMTSLNNYRKAASAKLWETWQAVFADFCQHQPTEDHLGAATKVLYCFVRKELMVPFHQGFVEHPTAAANTLNGRQKKTIGGWISVIHDALRDGRAEDGLMAFLTSQSCSERMSCSRKARSEESYAKASG
ncbi:hypothetical protein LTR09_012568 [Extremus antarcticus]|uniref:Phenylalanine ammonia-lyase n=1 Tax=Extremus antarcticus TaxID=702011 RepID=A0AAJ0D9U0_9PEZI|nr:hypothetical protein LTR09_012568 [Extremus antarcticus]